MKSYSWRQSDAFEGEVTDPLRMLALAVVSRWVDDRNKNPSEPAPHAWLEAAGIPEAWLEQLERFENRQGRKHDGAREHDLGAPSGLVQETV